MKRRNLFKAAVGAIAALPILKALDPAPVEATPEYGVSMLSGHVVEVGQSYQPFIYTSSSTTAHQFAKWVEAKEIRTAPYLSDWYEVGVDEWNSAQELNQP